MTASVPVGESSQLAQSSESVEALVDPLEKLTIKVKKNDYVVWIKLRPVQIKLYADFLTIPEIQEVSEIIDVVFQ